jgi:hypothetical protein
VCLLVLAVLDVPGGSLELSRLFAGIVLAVYCFCIILRLLTPGIIYQRTVEKKSKLTATEAVLVVMFSIIILTFLVNVFVERIEGVSNGAYVNER